MLMIAADEVEIWHEPFFWQDYARLIRRIDTLADRIRTSTEPDDSDRRIPTNQLHRT